MSPNLKVGKRLKVLHILAKYTHLEAIQPCFRDAVLACCRLEDTTYFWEGIDLPLRGKFFLYCLNVIMLVGIKQPQAVCICIPMA